MALAQRAKEDENSEDENEDEDEDEDEEAPFKDATESKVYRKWKNADIEQLPRTSLFKMVQRTGRPHADLLFPALKRYVRGEPRQTGDWEALAVLELEASRVVSPRLPLSPAVQGLLHAEDVLSLMGETVDKVGQVTDASIPLHTQGQDECVIVPLWWNLAKATGFALTTLGILLAITMRAGGADDGHIDDVARFLDLCEPVHEAYGQAGRRRVQGFSGSRAAIVKRRNELNSLFCPSRQGTSASPPVELPPRSDLAVPAASQAREQLASSLPAGSRRPRHAHLLHRICRDLD